MNAAELHKKLGSIEKVAAELGVDRRTARQRILLDGGTIGHGGTPTPDPDDPKYLRIRKQAADLYAMEKLNLKTIAKQLGISPGMTRQFIILEGIEIRPPSGRKGTTHAYSRDQRRRCDICEIVLEEIGATGTRCPECTYIYGTEETVIVRARLRDGQTWRYRGRFKGWMQANGGT